MILSLRGRLETRWFLAAAVALPWTGLLTLLHRPGDEGTTVAVRSTVAIVALMSLLGTVWEFAYHGCQQLRWDRDWPSLLVLGSVLLEGGPLWLAVGALPHRWVHRPGAVTFAVTIGSAWLLMWAFAQGPMRVLFIRWRYNGGRLSCAH